MSVMVPHGLSGYIKRRCKCDVCVMAYSAYKAKFYQRKLRGEITENPRLTHCKRGHDIAEVGRYTSGDCRACNRGRARRRRNEEHPNSVATTRLRTGRTMAQAAAAWTSYRMVSTDAGEHRAKDLFHLDWISIDTADIWCCALGTHLAIEYPELYMEETA